MCASQRALPLGLQPAATAANLAMSSAGNAHKMALMFGSLRGSEHFWLLLRRLSFGKGDLAPDATVIQVAALPPHHVPLDRRDHAAIGFFYPTPDKGDQYTCLPWHSVRNHAAEQLLFMSRLSLSPADITCLRERAAARSPALTLASSVFKRFLGDTLYSLSDRLPFLQLPVPAGAAVALHLAAMAERTRSASDRRCAAASTRASATSAAKGMLIPSLSSCITSIQVFRNSGHPWHRDASRRWRQYKTCCKEDVVGDSTLPAQGPVFRVAQYDGLRSHSASPASAQASS